ncbi:MAG: hypothetical protein RMJ84_03235 [Sandaracinaceae bacterium]|nr:hypothetical protein [Sandaracinaceae bacterium]
MRTREDLEAYLARSSYPSREIEENTWLIEDREGNETILMRLSDDLVLFRTNVVDLQAIDPARAKEFYALLLELNASDLLYGAYGLARTGNDGAKVVLTAAAQLAHLDYAEFVGILDDFSLAIAKHRKSIEEFIIRSSDSLATN